MTEFPIVPSETAILFFDTLNGYLHPTPARNAVTRPADPIPGMVKIERACREAGIAVFYTQGDHRSDGKDSARQIADLGYDGRPGDPKPRLVVGRAPAAGSVDVEIIPEIAPQPGDYIIKKHRWSAFHQTNLELSLRTAGIDTVMLAGGSIETGLGSTAYSARNRDFNVIVLRDVCTTRRDLVYDCFMEMVFPVFARVMRVDEAIAAIDSRG